MIKTIYALAAILCLLATLPSHAQVDITENGGELFAELQNTNEKENFPKLTDDNVQTKYVSNWMPGYGVYYTSAYPSVLNSYAIYSANDFPQRDLKSWDLEGSNDGVNWTLLDKRTNQIFEARFQRKQFSCESHNKAYRIFRLVMQENNGDNVIQFAEIEFLCNAAPAAPGDFIANALPLRGVALKWGSVVADSTAVERSADGFRYQRIAMLPAHSNTFTDTTIASGKQYAYRVRAVNKLGASKPSAYKLAAGVKPPDLQEITRFADGVIISADSITGNEHIGKITDNSIYTKYFTRSNAPWMQHYLPGGSIVKQYSLTSANDWPDRDPKSWILEGADDGKNWKLLDKRTGEDFTDRQETRTYVIDNNLRYKYHRLRILNNHGASSVQLAEWRLFGEGKGKITSRVATPDNFKATAVSGFQVNLDWNDVAINETGYRLEWSVDSLHWRNSQLLPANDNFFFCRYLIPLTKYYFRLRAENGKTYCYTSATTTTGEPALTWKEQWFSHEELLTRRYCDSSLVIYCDEKVDTAIDWIARDFTKVWKYVNQRYGNFGAPQLFIVLHSVQKPMYSGGHPAATFNNHHDWRNVIDLSNGEWRNRTNWNLGATTHEVGHIVEGASKDIDRSPSFVIWGDSKWAEIFGYDVYKNLGWEAESKQLYDDMMEKTDDFPRGGTHWFKDWFYPIYNTSDGGAALNRYFVLLKQYFPQHNSAYAKDLNMGEFVHFWSGAAGYDLRKQAEIAFGWNEAYELQWQQAKLDYPFLYK